MKGLVICLVMAVGVASIAPAVAVAGSKSKSEPMISLGVANRYGEKGITKIYASRAAAHSETVRSLNPSSRSRKSSRASRIS